MQIARNRGSARASTSLDKEKEKDV
jgi:hypothetical protein